MTPGQRPGFSDTDTGVPHGGEQHVMALVGHIPEEGTHFRRQQISRVAPVEVAMRRNATAVAKSTPGRSATTKRVLVNSAGE